MELLDWVEKNWRIKRANSVDFMYEEMESQSGRCLPIIYQPFDASKRSHWRDRGSVYDFLYSVHGEGKRILDLGPGDGWPSLVIAPLVREVVGADGSRRRVSVCSENAKRLGVKNAIFTHTIPGHPLPFADGAFDGVVAASSVEQTPDPRKTICEFYRVLKPGGRLRISYEALAAYRNGKEREVCFDSTEQGNCVITIYNRLIEEERADMYKIKCNVQCGDIFPIFLRTVKRTADIAFDVLSIQQFEELTPLVAEVRKCSLIHPSAGTFCHWMEEVGFREVFPTHSGAWVAGKIFDGIPEGKRPQSIRGVDGLIKPVVKTVVDVPAPPERDPLITAVK